MKSIVSFVVALIVLSFNQSVSAQNALAEIDKSYLSWNEKQTVQIGGSWREKGRIGGVFDGRVTSTDKAYNYKLRATLMSPEAIRATARREQILNGLNETEARKLVAEAENEKSLVVLIEIDPREGSGIIPNDWRVTMQPKAMDSESNQTIRGVKSQSLGNITAFKGVFTRDYDYDVFRASFPYERRKWQSDLEKHSR